jgi:hypothetical protein
MKAFHVRAVGCVNEVMQMGMISSVGNVAIAGTGCSGGPALQVVPASHTGTLQKMDFRVCSTLIGPRTFDICKQTHGMWWHRSVEDCRFEPDQIRSDYNE